jgi:hypothetical protein
MTSSLIERIRRKPRLRLFSAQLGARRRFVLLSDNRASSIAERMIQLGWRRKPESRRGAGRAVIGAEAAPATRA